jgi:cbb3-type cytochrome oxidase subunit 1
MAAIVTLDEVRPAGEPAILLKAREESAQRLMMAYAIVGLFFMLLPGTFLGVWNLIAISGGHAGDISTAWIQAHGHAQIFGWIGTFILGIGFYSIPKMTGRRPQPITRGWVAWLLWTTGVLLRWASGFYHLCAVADFSSAGACRLSDLSQFRKRSSSNCPAETK